jgi:hypothetical protein
MAIPKQWRDMRLAEVEASADTGDPEAQAELALRYSSESSNRGQIWVRPKVLHNLCWHGGEET